MGEDFAADRALIMPVVSLHGVPLSWDASALPEDPLSALLALPATTEPAALRIRVTRRTTAAPPRRGAPWFFHGVLQVSRVQGAALLDDGTSTAEVRDGEVSAELALVDGRLSPFASGLVGAAMLLAVRDLGLYDLHAAAVVDARDRGILIAGDSGSGKTTTTLALLEHGGAYVGDDRVLLRGDGGSVEVLAWPREFHVSEATVTMFPRLRALIGERYGAGEKVTLDPARAFPARARLALPRVDALLFPRIDTDLERTLASPIDRATAFGGLLVAGAMALLDGVVGGAAHLELLRLLAGQGTALDLALGKDALLDPSVIALAVEAALEAAT